MNDKKQHIINIAEKLFSEKGFEGTSIRDLATKAGVNVAMVNYYFGTKEKLFEKLVEHKAAYTKGMLDEIAKNDTYIPIEKIDIIIDNYISKLFANRQFHLVLHQQMMLTSREALHQAIVNILYPNTLIVKGIIEAGIKKGFFKKTDAPLLIATLMGTINQVLLSTKMCNKLLGKEDDYIPYIDDKFKKRLAAYLKLLMRSHLLS